MNTKLTLDQATTLANNKTLPTGIIEIIDQARAQYTPEQVKRLTENVRNLLKSLK